MVRCVDCGFLAFRDVKSRALVEVEKEIRDSGKNPGIDSGHAIYERYPLCFLQAFDLRQEVVDAGKQLSLVFNKERECSRFTQWHQGFTPKEHKEMLDEQWKREFERQVLKEDREWREKESRAATRRHWIDLLVFGALITIVTASVEIISAFIQRGDMFPALKSSLNESPPNAP